MLITPHTDLLYALQDAFECDENRDTAFAEIGLTGNQFAIDTWNRWRREMDQYGFYNFDEKPITKHRVAVREHYTFTLTTYVEIDASDADQAAELVKTDYTNHSWVHKNWSRGAEWFDKVTFEIDE